MSFQFRVFFDVFTVYELEQHFTILKYIHIKTQENKEWYEKITLIFLWSTNTIASIWIALSENLYWLQPLAPIHFLIGIMLIYWSTQHKKTH